MKETVYILFFRGVNVGGNNIIPMKKLAEAFEKIACRSVSTYIQSGNVVLQSSLPGVELHNQAAEAIKQNFGFSPSLIVLTKDELQDAVKKRPFQPQNGKDLHFYFCAIAPDPDIELLHSVKSPDEEFHLCDKVFYLLAPSGIGRSKLAAKIEKAMNTSVTARNLNTVQKVLEMCQNIE